MTLSLKGHVQDGRIIVDETVDLPNGAQVQLTLVDGDDLDDEDRARLHAALDEAQDELDRGEGIPTEQVLSALRASRPR